MQRAGLFIGVRQTGKLPELKDAVESARRMHEWSISQGMVDGTSTVLVTDEAEPVTQTQLLRAVRRLIDEVEPEQLILYFAGHGVALNGEQWLLSDAPDDANAAVDLRWTADVAETGAVPHVVFISDACRTAPEGVQAQQVRGGSIFPNAPFGDQRFVDIYYACGLGRASAEILSSEASAKSYRAVYTEVLLDTLRGDFDDAYVHLPDKDSAWYADPRKVRDVLAAQVPKRIRQKRLKIRYGQTPKASLSSDPGVWLARLDALPKTASSPRDKPRRPSRGHPTRPSQDRGPVGDYAPSGGHHPDGGLFPLDLLPDDSPTPRPMPRPVLAPSERKVRAGVRRTAGLLATPHGPDHFESGCGIKVRGASVIEAVASTDIGVELLSPELVRLHPSGRGGVSVVLQFGSGDVAVVPVLADFLTGLTMDEGELISVELEPSKYSQRWPDFAYEEARIRELRSQVAAASAFGRFEPRGPEFATLAQDMQSIKSLDPSLAIYAAYSYYALGDVERIAQMSDFLFADVGVRFFDLELLSRHLVRRQPRKEEEVLPSIPLLGQGWSLVMSHGTRMPAGLKDLPHMLRDSLWTLFRPEAFPLLTRALERGRIR